MMTDKEMIEDMLDMQVKLDEVLLKVRGLTYRDLLSQRAYDRAILDELGDVLHFCLSQTLAEIATAQHPDYHREILMDIFVKHQSDDELDILDWQKCHQRVLIKAFRLMKWLEFTPEEVYEAYKKKNAVNFQRQREGY